MKDINTPCIQIIKSEIICRGAGNESEWEDIKEELILINSVKWEGFRGGKADLFAYVASSVCDAKKIENLGQNWSNSVDPVG